MDSPALLSSATSIIMNAQHKAANAAHTIATLSVDDNEVGGSEFSSTSLFKPIVSLKEAEMETKAGVKVLQTAQGMIGSILNIKA
jgi:hypothetical protein